MLIFSGFVFFHSIFFMYFILAFIYIFHSSLHSKIPFWMNIVYDGLKSFLLKDV